MSKNECVYNNEFKFFELFTKFYSSTDSQERLLNSSNLRSLLCDTDYPCISTKTFDANIHLLNEKLHPNKANRNPVYQTLADLKPLPLHTNIFYHRLPFCLNLNLNERELYNEQPEDNKQKESREKLNLLMGVQSTNPALTYTYTFDIRKFHMPSFFAPLFVGIIGSLKKEKTSWQSFREYALEISNSFCNENHPEINPFLPKSTDERRALYTYWLELHFSDELFDLISEFDKLIQGNDRMLSYNLNILADSLSQELFLTRINQKKFLQHMKATLEQYLNMPLINPITNKPSGLDLCNVYSQSSAQYHNEEIHLLREIALK